MWSTIQNGHQPPRLSDETEPAAAYITWTEGDFLEAFFQYCTSLFCALRGCRLVTQRRQCVGIDRFVDSLSVPDRPGPLYLRPPPTTTTRLFSQQRQGRPCETRAVPWLNISNSQFSLTELTCWVSSPVFPTFPGRPSGE